MGFESLTFDDTKRLTIKDFHADTQSLALELGHDCLLKNFETIQNFIDLERTNISSGDLEPAEGRGNLSQKLLLIKKFGKHPTFRIIDFHL